MGNENTAVVVNVSLSGGGVTRFGFGKALLLSNTGNAWGTPELTREYTKDSFSADFASTTPEYQLLTAYFAQPIKSPSVLVGKGTHKPTRRLTIGLSLVSDDTLYKINVYSDGVLWSASYTSGGSTDNDTIINALVAALTPSAWASLTSYGVGDRVLHDTGKVYEATIAGTSGGAATAATVTSGVGPFDFRGLGAQQLSVQFNAGGAQNFNITAHRAIKAGSGATGNYPVTGTFNVTVPDYPGAQAITVTAAANASAMAAQIAPQIIGGFPIVNGTEVDLSPDREGTSSAITISGTACLGFTDGAGSLAGGSTVANRAAVTATELAAIMSGITNGTATASGGALTLTSTTTGVAGTATVLAASTADTIMGGEFATNVVKTGTAAGAGAGPTGTGSAISDGSVTWEYISTPNFTAAATGSGGSKIVTATGSAAGNWFALEPLASRDTAAVSNLMALIDTTTDPGIATDLDAIYSANPDWYALLLLFQSSAIVTTASTGAAAWAQGKGRLLLVSTADTAAATSAFPGSDMLDVLTDEGDSYVAGMWHPRDYEWFAAAKDGYFLPLTPGSDNWCNKTYGGVTPVNLTPTQQTNLNARRAAFYFTRAGVNVDGGIGQVEDPSYGFIDNRRNIDDWATNLADDLLDLQYKNNKIANTNAGRRKYDLAIRARNDADIVRGIISPDPLDPTNAQAPIMDPYTVFVPPVSDATSFNTGTRALTGVTTVWKLAGAIDSITVNASVSE